LLGGREGNAFWGGELGWFSCVEGGKGVGWEGGGDSDEGVVVWKG